MSREELDVAVVRCIECGHREGEHSSRGGNIVPVVNKQGRKTMPRGSCSGGFCRCILTPQAVHDTGRPGALRPIRETGQHHLALKDRR